MRERLLREENLTLDKCVQICRASELSRENSKTIQGKTEEEIHAVKKSQRRDKRDEICCNFCGITHEKTKLKCPAFGKKCKKCGKENHFAVKCKTKHDKTRKSKPIHTVSESSGSFEDIMTITEMCVITETINQVKEAHSKSQQLFAGMLLDKKLVNFQIDCGATCNVIPVQLLNTDTQLEETEKVLVMYNKSRLKPLGKCRVKLRNPRNDKLYRLEFQVVDQNDRIPLLGRKASEAMKLIKVQYENILAIDSIVTKQRPGERIKDKEELINMDTIKTEFGDVFTGVGCLEGEYKIEIDKSVPPVKLPKRRVPVAMMAPLKEELKELEAKGIIAPVERSTDWSTAYLQLQVRIH